MEWVETTGKTLDEAKDAALDQLGVTEDETEFEVLSEPKPGLFGRTRGDARVRARIRPTQPRPKVERRDRRKRSTKNESDTSPAASTADRPLVDDPAASDGSPPEDAPVVARSSRSRGKGRSPRPVDASESDKQQGAPVSDTDRNDTDRSDANSNVDLDTHTAIVTEFVTGLVAAFGYEATVEPELVDDENAEVRVNGHDLGLLVGPKGATLAAVQELSRTVVHRQVPGMAEGRVRVDVAGYRQRRKEALERFVQQVAEQVRESGVAKALEPMAPPDRKVVHDTINEIEGVSTVSEGEEPRRRVVVLPS